MNMPDRRNGRTVIFDFDGVIINSRLVQERALEYSYRQVIGEGRIPYEEFFLQSGQSLENIFKTLGLPSTMIGIYREFSRKNISQIEIYDNMQSILQFLKEDGFFCALCTGKERVRTIEILKHLELEQYFDCIICSDDVSEPKPDPESLNRIIKEMHVQKQGCIMVGDGIHDVQCAKNAGISSIAVTWGEVDKQQLQVQYPTWLVDTVEELKETIKKWQSEDIKLGRM